MLKRFYSGVIRYRKIIFVVFILAAITGAILKPLVGVNHDMKDYLPEDSPSTQALSAMQEEFDGDIPNARVMIKDVTYKEALSYKTRLEQVDGVEEVTWLDDSSLLSNTPLEFMDQDALDTYFALDKDGKTGDALMTVTIDKEKRLEAVSEIRKIIGDENNMGGDAVSTAVATVASEVEIPKVALLSVILVFIILIFITRSWLDPLIILAGIGIAIVINNGTNLIFGEVSFITNASGSILQLAVSLDYSVFLIHRFEECRRARGLDPVNGRAVTDKSKLEEAMLDALTKSSGSIASSGLTTIIGFLALIFMRFRIGPDMGLALAKGVLISLITVFVFTPSMILLFSRLTDRTRHKRFLPDFTGFGKVVKRLMVPLMIVFVVLIVPSFVISNQNDYYYGASHIFGSGTQVGDDKEEITKVFGEDDTYVVMVPKGDNVRENELTKKLEEIPQVKNIRSYGKTLSQTVPSNILPDSITGLLVSDNYSRIVLSIEAAYEGEETFGLVEKLRNICKDVYGDKYYLAGEGVSTYDLMETTTSDMLKINLIAILTIFMILVIMFRRFLLPLLLVACIETAIWINMAIPYITDSPVFYMVYLIISCVQLGATVDYAILLTSRYREYRAGSPEENVPALDKKEAVVETIRSVTASICTSGSALIIVGFLMGVLSTNGILAQLGIFIGRGAICSLLIVLFVLPGLLYTFDRFICVKKTSG